MANETKQQMVKAKKLIQAKRYEDARAILITIDHPMAEKWLSKLPAPAQGAKGTQKQMSVAGCAALIAILFICGLIFALRPTNATVDDIRLAVIEVSGVTDVDNMSFNDINNQVWVDACVQDGYMPDEVAAEITRSIQALGGMREKELFVSVTDSATTRLYENARFIIEGEREFC